MLSGAAEELELDRPFGAVVDALDVSITATDPERSAIGRLMRGLADATRALLLERAVLERRRVMAFHIPGRGSVTRRDGAYDFQPE